MLRKYYEIKWGEEARRSFAAIKPSLAEALVLTRLDFAKEFLTFTFALEGTITWVLLQKNIERRDQPISLFSRCLCDVELKYSLLEK